MQGSRRPFFGLDLVANFGGFQGSGFGGSFSSKTGSLGGLGARYSSPSSLDACPDSVAPNHPQALSLSKKLFFLLHSLPGGPVQLPNVALLRTFRIARRNIAIIFFIIARIDGARQPS